MTRLSTLDALRASAVGARQSIGVIADIQAVVVETTVLTVQVKFAVRVVGPFVLGVVDRRSLLRVPQYRRPAGQCLWSRRRRSARCSIRPDFDSDDSSHTLLIPG